MFIYLLIYLFIYLSFYLFILLISNINLFIYLSNFDEYVYYGTLRLHGLLALHI